MIHEGYFKLLEERIEQCEKKKSETLNDDVMFGFWHGMKSQVEIILYELSVFREKKGGK